MIRDPLDVHVRTLVDRVRGLPPEDRAELRPAVFAVLRSADALRGERAALGAEIRRLLRLIGGPGEEAPGAAN